MFGQSGIREFDEFGIILIGFIIFLGGLAYFITSQIPSKTTNVTEIYIKYLKLDTTNRSVTILDSEEKIFSSLFLKKELVYPLYFSKEEIENIEKIFVDFKSERGISEIYFVKDKSEIKIRNEIDKKLLNGKILVRVEETENYVYYFFLAIIATIVFSYVFYKKYPEKVFEIEVIAISLIFIFTALIIYFGTKKLEDTVHLKITVVYSAKLLKSFDFKAVPSTYNVTLSFRLKKGIHTADLKIYLKSDKENVLFFGKPFGSFNRTYTIDLISKNSIVFEIIGEGMYELEDIRVVLGPARS